MKKFYAGIAATALAAAGLACSTAAASATTPGWSSAFGPELDDARVSLAVASDGSSAYTAWPNSSTDESIVHVTTTALSGDHTTVSGQLTVAGYVSATAVTSTGALLAIVNPDGVTGSPELFVGDIHGSAATATALSGFDRLDAVTVSPDGGWAVVVGSQVETGQSSVQLIDLSGPDAGAGSAVSLPGAEDVGALAITNAGTAYAAGDTAEANELWSVSGTTATEIAELQDGRPTSIAVLGDDSVAVGSDGDDAVRIDYVAGGHVDHTVALDDMGYLSGLTASGQTVWAYNGSGELSRVDGTTAQTFVTSYGELWNAAPALSGNTLYIAGADWDQDADTDGPASLFALAAPAAPSDLWHYAADASTITLGWTPAVGTANDADYRVILTDQVTDEVHTGTLYKDDVTPTYASINIADVDPSHRYDVSVEAFNGAFYSTALTGEYLPEVTGEGHVTITGSTTVGSTLTAHLTSTWPAEAALSYQWMVVQSQGESGGLVPIPGTAAQHDSFVLTDDLLGERVGVQVTARQDGFADSSSESDVTAAITRASTPGSVPTQQPTQQPTQPAPTQQPTQPAPTQQPTQHPAPAPVRVGPIKTKPIDAHATRVTLKAPGVTHAPGKVKVFAGKRLIGTATIKNGKLVLKLDRPLSKGKHHVKLKYAGSAKVAKFNKSVKLKVA